MHLTRPKSSKGRSRPAVDSSLYPWQANCVQSEPESPELRGPDRNLRSRSQPIMLEANHLSQEDVFHMLQPPQSLNKYKVLPSIERKSQSGVSLHKDISNLKIAVTQTFSPSDSTPEAGSGSLLLAVRAPCGRRFQQSFDPTHTLLTVKTSAEARFGARYKDACIETMEVPRRTFTDLHMTLAQCAIPNRSVLCISQKTDSMGEQE